MATTTHWVVRDFAATPLLYAAHQHMLLRRCGILPMIRLTQRSRMMRDLKIVCVVTLCILFVFALVGTVYAILNPEIVAAFIGPIADR